MKTNTQVHIERLGRHAMTREEFEIFMVKTIADANKTWQQKTDEIVEQWEEDTSAAWGRGVEVGRENP